MTKKIDRLSDDAKAAKLSGLSYGKYVALRHEKQQRNPKMRDERELEAAMLKEGYKKCSVCKRLFMPRTYNNKYCSVDCYEKMHGVNQHETW